MNTLVFENAHTNCHSSPPSPSASPVAKSKSGAPDPQVIQKPTRRRFSLADKRRILKLADDAVLVIDDSIEAKPYTDESELIGWHWDHTGGRSVKGFHLLSCLYYSQGVSLPVAFELIKKPHFVTDKKTGRQKRQAKQTKNELYRQMLSACVRNGLLFGYVLNDTWFASAENMLFIKQTLHKEFVMPLKDNRKITLEAPKTPHRRFVAVSE